jgi:protein tyrosine/serine phosphatase
MSLSRRFAAAALLVSSFALSACGGAADASSAQDDAALVANAQVVSPGIYRSARPTAADLASLKAQGVKYVLDLEDDMSAVRREQPIAQGLGMTFISEPMSGFWYPNDGQVNRIEALLADPTKRPILVHCQHGQDRTGLIIGLHRVFQEGWDPARAYQEMRALGFHPALFLLNHYYEVKTGWDD